MGASIMLSKLYIILVIIKCILLYVFFNMIEKQIKQNEKEIHDLKMQNISLSLKIYKLMNK